MTLTLRTVRGSRDLYIGEDGLMATAAGLDAVLQLCESAVRTLLGECVLAADRGIPFFDTAFAGIPNLPQFEAAFRRTILAVTDVTRISAFDAAVKDGALRYSATIVTVYGEGTING